MGNIREYRPDDRQAMLDIFVAGDTTRPEAVAGAFDSYRFLVFEDEREIRGFAGTAQDTPREWDLRVYVHPAHRNRGIGGQLYEAGMARIREAVSSPQPSSPSPPPSASPSVTVRYRADQGAGRAFYARRGYEVWYGMDELIYRGGRLEFRLPPGFSIRAYDDARFTDWMRIVGDAFEPMRRSHDFRPHNVFEESNTPERQQEIREKYADHIFLAYEGDRLVGSASLDGDFIDEVAVDPAHQGQGYGKLLTLFCLNELIDCGHPHPRTSVVTDNEPARSMYYRLGFELVQTNEWARGVAPL